MEKDNALRLINLELRIGQTVQLITQGPHPTKYYTRLIGHADPHFLMLRVPMENGWAVTLKEGQSLDVRVFCGVSLYEFESRLETLLLNPRNYMLLSCPSTIHETRFRSHERVQCNLPVRIAQAPAVLTVGIEGGFRLQDLSGSGAALVGPQMLGELGQSLKIELTFDLAATGTHEQLVLGADLQSVQPLRDTVGKVSGYLHGIRFHEVEPRVLLLVNELQKP
jgi:c-di-GMP-binding flagellar brake protein YcgR